MPQIRKVLVGGAVAFGAAAALFTAPAALADTTDPNLADSSLLPGCETMGGSSVTGGQSTDCAQEGNSQITATPPVYPVEDGFWGFPGFGMF